MARNGISTQDQSGEGRHRGHGPADLGQQHPQFHEAATASAHPFRQRGAEQIDGGEFLPQRLVVAGSGFEFGEPRRGGPTFEDLTGQLGDRFLLFGEGEVHG